MKHKLVCAVVAIALLVPALSLAGPLVFSVSPGQLLQGAQFGMSSGKLQPYIGFDLLGASGKVKITDTATDTYEEITAGATLMIPSIGARYYLSSKELKRYVYASFLKSIATVSAKTKTGTSESKFEGAAKDQLTSLLGFWGVSAGFGAEYPFSEHFSVGGEYGFRYLRTHAKGDADAGSLLLTEGMSDEVTASLKHSMARIVLNYEF